jgi:hypothetical protein
MPNAAIIMNNGAVTLKHPGCLYVKSDATGSGSILGYNSINSIDPNGHGLGTAEVESYISIGKYHYVSSPIANAISSMLTSQNVYSFDTDNNHGVWNNFWQPFSGTLAVGEGYTAFSDVVSKLTFDGLFNFGTKSVDIYRNDVNAPTDGGYGGGWNLIGNPYPSGVNINSFITVNSAAIGPDAVYFWDDDGSRGTGYTNADYSSHNGITGTASVNGHMPSGIISSGQGFFVRAASAGTSQVNFTEAQRVSTNNNFFRISNDVNVSKFNLHVTSEIGLQNDIAFAFTEYSNDGLDDLDVEKLVGNSNLALYSTMDNKAYSIQMLSSFNGNAKTIPIAIKTSQTGNFTFTVSQFENMGILPVSLTDLLTNTTYDLNPQSSITVNIVQTGTISNRFILNFGNTSVNAVKNIVNTAKPGVIAYNGHLQINLNGLNNAEVVVFNLHGQLISQQTLSAGQNSELNHIYNNGCYIVKMVSGGNVFTQKVIIN